MRSELAPLREREFRLLFVGRLTSQAGSAIAPIALAFAVLDITGSATDLGIVIAAGFVPQILLFLFGGVIADRFPRHRVMVTIPTALCLLVPDVRNLRRLDLPATAHSTTA